MQFRTRYASGDGEPAFVRIRRNPGGGDGNVIPFPTRTDVADQGTPSHEAQAMTALPGWSQIALGQEVDPAPDGKEIAVEVRGCARGRVHSHDVTQLQTEVNCIGPETAMGTKCSITSEFNICHADGMAWRVVLLRTLPRAIRFSTSQIALRIEFNSSSLSNSHSRYPNKEPATHA